MKKSTKHLLLGGAAVAGILWYSQRAVGAPQSGGVGGLGGLFDMVSVVQGRFLGLIGGESSARQAVKRMVASYGNNPITMPRKAYETLYRGHPRSSWPWITDELMGLGAPSMLCHRGMADASVKIARRPTPKPLPDPRGNIRRYA